MSQPPPVRPAPDAPLRLGTLGRCEAQVEPAGPLAPGSRHGAAGLGPGKALAVLVYLGCSPRRTASRDHLVDLLWADLDPARARQALRQTIYAVRRTLGEQVLTTAGDAVSLGPGVTCDRTDFLRAIDAGDLERAVALYQGDFLPGFSAPGGAAFEHWADLERHQLRAAFLRSGEELAGRLVAQGRHGEAQQLAARVRDADPTLERGWRLLLRTLQAGGASVTLAREVAQLQDILADEGRSAEPATAELLRRLAESPPADADTTPAGTLVAELVGREQEFTTLLGLWDRARRGAGTHAALVADAGIGKTRLLADLDRRLRALGARTVRLRAAPGGGGLPYGFASDLAGALATLPGAPGVSPGSAAALLALNPALSSRFSATPDPASGDEALRRRSVALAELVAAVADEHPLALLLDDLHWADAESRQLLRGALDRIATSPVLCVSASRPSSDQPVRTESTTLIRLEPLPPAAITALVASLGQLPPEPWADQVGPTLHRATNGSPLLVLESLELAIQRGLLSITDGSWRCPDPAAFEREQRKGSALERRVAGLDPRARRVLLTLGLAGVPLPTDDLDDLAGTAAEAIAELDRLGLARREDGGWVPSHDEIAAASERLAAPDDVRETHRRLGALFERQEPTRATAYRAIRSYEAAGDDEAVGRIARAWIARARRLGDGRQARALVADLVGARPDVVERVHRQLPVAIRLGLDRPTVRLAAGAVVLVAAVLIGSQLSPPPPPAVELATVRGTTAGQLEIVEVPIPAGTSDTVIDLSRGRVRSVPAAWSTGEATYASLARDGRLAMTVSGAGGGPPDVVILDREGRLLQQTTDPGDDFSGPWEPDGRHLLVVTARWTPKARPDADIGRLDVETGQVTQLTAGPDYDTDPALSPDGTRIGFWRRHYDGRPPEACASALGELGAPTCAAVPGLTNNGRLAGWLDDRTLLVQQSEPQEASRLLALRLDDGAVRVVDHRPVAARVSADGRWVLCLCQREGDAAAEWYLYPSEHPEEARRLVFGADAGAMVTVRFSDRYARPTQLRRLAILPVASVPLDGGAELRARAVDAAGASREPAAVRWWSGDTSVAVVTPAGRLLPRRPGLVTVHVTAGGVLFDSTRVTVVAAGSREVLRESWRSLDAWRVFGVPEPQVVTGPGGTPAFLNNGDGSYVSGAYTRASWSGREGLGLETTFLAPFTGLNRWQMLNLALTPEWDETLERTWDHRTGSGPQSERLRLSACRFGYGGEGEGHWRRLIVGGGRESGQIEVGDALRDGRWHRLRLQIFTDGRCGVAVDDTIVWRSKVAVGFDEPFRASLVGNSRDTRMLVGPLTVWIGERNDIDWPRGDRRSRD